MDRSRDPARRTTEPKRSSAPARSSRRGEEKREGDDGGDQPRGVHLRFGSRAARVWSRRRTGVVTGALDRKSTRLNSSHPSISYAVFCLKKKNTPTTCPESSMSTAAPERIGRAA